MPFALETGDGVAGANAYVGIPFVEDYLMGGRLARFAALPENEKEAAIIAATQLVDISYEWLGNRKTAGQGLSWPRTKVEADGFAVEGVPSAVKKAACEAVWLSMTSDSLFSADNNRVAVRERVEGAVDITYASAKGSGNEAVTRFEVLDKLLRGLYRTGTGSGGSSVGAVRVERV